MVKVVKVTSQADKKIIKQAVLHLLQNNILIYPTDTSYGAGVVLNQTAINNLNKLKNRGEGKYYSVIIPTFNWIFNNLEVNTFQENILRKYLPGEYTFILMKKYSKETLGVRLPKNNLVQLIARELGEPLTATSANLSGHPDSYDLEDLQSGILKTPSCFEMDILVLDSGRLEKGKKSTVIDLTKKKPVIIRQGSGKFPK